MVVTAVDNLCMNILGGNLSVKILIEVLRKVTDFEIYNAAGALHKAGFKDIDSKSIKAEIEHAVLVIGKFSDNYVRIEPPEEEIPEQAITVDPPPVLQ